METVKLHLLGANVIPPEQFVCIVLQPEGQHKVIPIWTGGPEALVTVGFVRGWDDGKRRAINVLLEVFESLGGVVSVEMVNYHEGAVIFDVSTESGLTVEMAATDTMVVAHHFGVDITAEAELVNQLAIFVTDADLAEYLEVSFATPESGESGGADESDPLETSASGDPQADADFEALMRSLWNDGGDDPLPK